MAEVCKERLSELLLSGVLLKHTLANTLCSFLMTFQVTFRSPGFQDAGRAVPGQQSLNASPFRSRSPHYQDGCFRLSLNICIIRVKEGLPPPSQVSKFWRRFVRSFPAQLLIYNPLAYNPVCAVHREHSGLSLSPPNHG